MINNLQYRPSPLSQISHEPRIPLTGILGMVHFLEGTPLNVEQKEYLQGILESANRLLTLEGKLHSYLSSPDRSHLCRQINR